MQEKKTYQLRASADNITVAGRIRWYSARLHRATPQDSVFMRSVEVEFSYPFNINGAGLATLTDLNYPKEKIIFGINSVRSIETPGGKTLYYCPLEALGSNDMDYWQREIALYTSTLKKKFSDGKVVPSQNEPKGLPYPHIKIAEIQGEYSALSNFVMKDMNTKHIVLLPFVPEEPKVHMFEGSAVKKSWTPVK